MDILLFASTWGMTRPTLEANLRKVAEAGYDGVELVMPSSEPELEALRTLLDELQLERIVQIHSFGETPVEHLDLLRQQLDRAASLSPRLVNSHTGKDYYELNVSAELIEATNTHAAERGLTLVHETHRGRAMFSLPATVALLERVPSLEITADFSHFCCVHESLLHDQEERVAKVLPHARHVHARVGHTQASQIPDPRAPEWAYAVDRHLQWWDRIVELRRAAGAEALTICAEFGPYPYMTQQPFTKQDLVDLWEVNGHMRDLLRARYSTG